MTPWRSNQLYQDSRIGCLSGTEAVGLDWRYAEDNISIGSDQDICTGGLEINLYPSMTSLDKISETNSSASGGSIGKISRFLNSLFKRKNKSGKKDNLELKRTSSLPHELSKTDGQLNAERVTPSPPSPPVPPRNVSLALTTPRRGGGSVNLTQNGPMTRRNSEGNIEERCDNVRRRKVKRRAPLPPKVPREYLGMSRNTDRSISIINGKNNDIEDKWKKHLGVKNTEVKRGRQNVKRKKRVAPMPPVPQTTSKPGVRTEDEGKIDAQRRINERSSKNSQALEIYATWPKNQGENPEEKSKVKVTFDKAKIVPNRWSVVSGCVSKTQDNQDSIESSDQMLKIYIPISRDEHLQLKGSHAPKARENPVVGETSTYLKNGVSRGSAGQQKDYNDEKVRTKYQEAEGGKITGKSSLIKENPKQPVWNQVISGSVKSMAATFDDIYNKEVHKSVVKSSDGAKETGRNKMGKKKSNVAGKLYKGDNITDVVVDNCVENKPPSGQIKGARRRRNRRKDSSVARKRLSPLFETSGQKNDIEEEITSLLKDLPLENHLNAGTQTLH